MINSIGWGILTYLISGCVVGTLFGIANYPKKVPNKEWHVVRVWSFIIALAVFLIMWR